MPKKIILPNNAFGCLILLAVLMLIFAVPFCVVFWLVSLVAPWWVSCPLAVAAGMISFLILVTFKH